MSHYVLNVYFFVILLPLGMYFLSVEFGIRGRVVSVVDLESFAPH